MREKKMSEYNEMEDYEFEQDKKESIKNSSEEDLVESIQSAEATDEVAKETGTIEPEKFTPEQLRRIEEHRKIQAAALAKIQLKNKLKREAEERHRQQRKAKAKQTREAQRKNRKK